MKPFIAVFAVSCLAAGQAVHAQQESGSLGGTVLHPEGQGVRDAPVRAVNKATGTDARTRSSESGAYEFEDLPAGTYVVSVFMPCCQYNPYVNENVVVSEGQANEFDIELVEDINIEGDDPALLNAEFRDRQVVPDFPTPRTADGRPDLSGVWLTSEDPYPEPAQALPWAEELAARRRANLALDHPHTNCLPGSPPVDGQAAFMAKFVQTPALVVILAEGLPGFRQVFLDGRGHPDNPNPSWMGHSVGRWESDTLVVDTVHFNNRGWTDVYPRTLMLHMEERYRRTDYGHLEVRVTFDDPGVFEVPWVWNQTWDLAPQEELMEYVCENNKWAHEVTE